MASKIRSDLEGVVYVSREDLTPPLRLAAGDSVPDDIAVGDHLLAGKRDKAEPDPGPTDDTPEGEPKGNASRDEWAAYADSIGVTYKDDAKREDIKAAVTAAS